MNYEFADNWLHVDSKGVMTSVLLTPNNRSRLYDFLGKCLVHVVGSEINSFGMPDFLCEHMEEGQYNLYFDCHGMRLILTFEDTHELKLFRDACYE